MDEKSKSPEPPRGPPQNTSTPARGDFYDSSSEHSDEYIGDEDSLEHSEDDLDEYLKNAEGLSDQTMGDLRQYDCSFSLSTGKSLTSGNLHTSSNKHFHDLSCSMIDCDKSIYLGTLEKVPRTRSDEKELEIHILKCELEKAQEKIKLVTAELEDERLTNEILVGEVKDAKQHTSKLLNRAKINIAKVRKYAITQAKRIDPVNESYDFANLSMCTFEGTKNGNPNFEGPPNCRLSSYISQLESKDSSIPNINHQSIQTSPTPFQNYNQECNATTNEENIDGIQAANNEMNDDEIPIVQPKFNKLNELFRSYKVYSKIPKQEIDSAIKEAELVHKKELSELNQNYSNHQKHLQESLNAVKDELKTMKMRYQEAMKHKDKMREMAAHRSEMDGENGNVENVLEENIVSDDVRAKLDDSSSSFQSNNEEIFSNSNLSRMDKSYLRLTPLEYLNDEVVEAVQIPESCRQMLEDKDLKYADLEKKFEANKRYLEEQTHDRESEREEFQQMSELMQNQLEELKKDNAKLMEENKQIMYQVDDLTTRLSSSEDNELDLTQKWEKTKKELQSSCDKVFELRMIIRDQEIQMDIINQQVMQIEEQKQVLRDELEKKDQLMTKEQPIYKEQETFGTIALDVTEEIHHQIQDITRKIEMKLLEKDIFQFSHTRPNSSCSGVASAVSTEDISCREIVGRNAPDHFPAEHIRSAIFNEIHRLEEQLENLLRYDDMIIKKIKDSELQTGCQKTKIQELESQISSFQEKCSSQMVKIADLEGVIDTLRFESSNQSLISALQTRLAAASKQIDQLRILLADKEKELAKVKTGSNGMREHLAKKLEKKDGFTQTSMSFEDNLLSADSMFEGVSPEKIRRMDSANPLNASLISLSRTVLKDGQSVGFEPEISSPVNFQEQGRSGKGGISFGGGDSCGTAGDSTIREIDDNLHQLQQLLQQKDKEIQRLNRKLGSLEKQKSDKCEHESIVIETDLNPVIPVRGGSPAANTGANAQITQRPGPGSDGDSSNYEISYSHDYQVEGDLLKYLGTKLLYQGPRIENIVSQGERRIQETDQQIEIATLNTHIVQLKRALDEEKRKSSELTKRLKLCEEEKAATRSSPVTRAPVQNIVSSVSVTQMQQKELARQVEEGRKLLKEKDKEIRSLKSLVNDLGVKLKEKETREKELLTRLSNTIDILKHCEDHGRQLTVSNQEQVHEIRRLRTQLDKANVVNRNGENYPQPPSGAGGNGSEYFENYMRAKSHRKALAWQKKYLSSVILGYKSILRQSGHGSEHPDLLQTLVPIAPSAVGYLDASGPKTRLRICILTVIATVRMKFMVSRWCKKRQGETSPDSEYKASKPSCRADLCIIRPRKTIINRVNAAQLLSSAIDSNVNVQDSRQGMLGDISQYLSRFASLENEISSSLSRNLPPSK